MSEQKKYSNSESQTNSSKIKNVKKRDGREVPFNAEKITQAIFKASKAINKENQELAQKLSGQVVLLLEEKFQDKIPEIEEIQDIVERVLIQADEADMAKAYILYRDERRRAREELKIRHAPQNIPPVVEPSSDEGYMKWERGRIAQVLEMETGIPSEIASQVAKNVERKVFLSGMKQISTALIRELVDNELFEMGYKVYLKKQGILGLPKFDLDRFLYPKGTIPSTFSLHSLEKEILSVTLRQYALEEVFSRDVVESHFKGTMHIHGLEEPCKALLITAPSSFPVPWGVEDKMLQTVLQIVMTERLAEYSQEKIILESSESRFIEINPRMLFITHSVGATKEPCSSLVLDGGIDEELADVTSNFLEEYTKIAMSGGLSFLPPLILRVSDKTFNSPVLNKVLEKSIQLASRVKYPVFHLKQTPFPPWIISTITLNLARCAYKSGKDQGVFWNDVMELLGIAIKAHLDKKRFIHSLESSTLSQLSSGTFGRNYIAEEAWYLIEIVGLGEAVSYMTEDKEESYIFAQNILSRLNEECINASQRHALSFMLSGRETESVAKRMARLDIKEGLITPQEVGFNYTSGPNLDHDPSEKTLQRLYQEGPLYRYFQSTMGFSPPEKPEKLMEFINSALSEGEIYSIKVI